jgi:hypothetical protein
MDPKLLKKTIALIHKQYPEFAGCQPKVRKQTPSDKASYSPAQTFLLTFNHTGTVQSQSGSRSISRYLRVVVNEQGKIIKVTTSR